MIKSVVLSLAILAGSSLVAMADSPRLPNSGAPFCKDKDELQSYVMALMAKDKDKMDALDCILAKGGLKIDVLDDEITPPAVKEKMGGIYVEQIRLYGQSQSMVGFAMIFPETKDTN